MSTSAAKTGDGVFPRIFFFFFFFGGGGVLTGSLIPYPISDQKNVIFHTSCQYIPYDNTLNFITLCRTKIHGVLF